MIAPLFRLATVAFDLYLFGFLTLPPCRRALPACNETPPGARQITAMPIYQTETVSSYSSRWLQRTVIGGIRAVVVAIMLAAILILLTCYYIALWYDIPFSALLEAMYLEAGTRLQQWLSE